MVQSHIINLPKPWKVFFDCYGHLHLHAASMICVEERSAISDKKYNIKFYIKKTSDDYELDFMIPAVKEILDDFNRQKSIC
jgi:hypothetical protein